MGFGDPRRGHHPWVLSERDSLPVLARAHAMGINFFDTANMYSLGGSEEVLGRFLRDAARREDVFIATKVYFPMRRERGAKGLSRANIERELDDSLRRLGVDYIDLYQIHRWDEHTPVEETLNALGDAVRAGKVRYLGASSMFAWQFAKALYTADRLGVPRFVTMQNHYNLLYREEEREMNPLCRAEGVAILPWSPLARGALAREGQGSSPRASRDTVTRTLYGKTQEADAAVRACVAELARARGLSMAQVALAWLLHKPGVVAPILGATRVEHVEAAVPALDVVLSAEEVALLERAYVPHEVAGHG
jgi:aryl-alcohol dehydrogenase-like predicted oxidoreductase